MSKQLEKRNPGEVGICRDKLTWGKEKNGQKRIEKQEAALRFDSLELTYIELERKGGAISALSSATIRDMTDITVCKESSSPCLTRYKRFRLICF